MLNYFIASQIVYSFLGLLFWLVIALLIRRKVKKNADGKYNDRPTGFWTRLVTLGFDFNLIYFISGFLCYWGTTSASNKLLMLLISSYFFFSWLLISTTIGGRLVGIKIIAHKDSQRPKIYQLALRFVVSLFAAIGWIFIFFNKNKRMLHDLAGGTKVIYSKEANAKIASKKVKWISLFMLGMVAILFVSILIFGLGNRITNYAESNQVKLYDTDRDSLPNMIAIDSDKNGKFDTFKFDVNRDVIVDSIGYDLNGDEIADAFDVNDDGKIDAYDFNNDGKMDQTSKSGMAWIWAGRIWFWFLDAIAVVLLGLTIFFERKNN